MEANIQEITQILGIKEIELFLLRKHVAELEQKIVIFEKQLTDKKE